MGSKAGCLVTAAKRCRLSPDEYARRINQGLKYCWRCRCWRSRSDFGIDRSRGDGLTSRCTSCRKAPLRQGRLFLYDQVERYRIDPEYRAKVRFKVYARKRSLEPLPVEAAADLLERTNGLCLYCDKPATTFDHLVPVARGGKTVPGNMAPACVSCNSKKGARTLDDFLTRYNVPITDRIIEFVSLGYATGALMDGSTPDEWPEDLNVRQFPEARP